MQPQVFSPTYEMMFVLLVYVPPRTVRHHSLIIYASLVISHIPRPASLKADVLHFHVDLDGNGISQRDPPREVAFFFCLSFSKESLCLKESEKQEDVEVH